MAHQAAIGQSIFVRKCSVTSSMLSLASRVGRVICILSVRKNSLMLPIGNSISKSVHA